MTGRSLPGVQAYLEKLPGGIAGYPNHLAKGSLLRSVLGEKPLADVAGALPAAVRPLLEGVAHTSWIPEVHFRALLRAVRDRHFQSDAAFLSWAHEAQLRLFQGPLYRVLFFAVSPQTIVRTAAGRWGKFHQGTELVAQVQPEGADLTLYHPPGLLDALDHAATCEGFRAAATLSGGREVTCTVAERTATSAKLLIRWR